MFDTHSSVLYFFDHSSVLYFQLCENTPAQKRSLLSSSFHLPKKSLVVQIRQLVYKLFRSQFSSFSMRYGIILTRGSHLRGFKLENTRELKRLENTRELKRTRNEGGSLNA